MLSRRTAFGSSCMLSVRKLCCWYNFKACGHLVQVLVETQLSCLGGVRTCFERTMAFYLSTTHSFTLRHATVTSCLLIYLPPSEADNLNASVSFQHISRILSYVYVKPYYLYMLACFCCAVSSSLYRRKSS